MVKAKKIKGGDTVNRPSALANDSFSTLKSDKVRQKSTLRLQKQDAAETFKVPVVDDVLSHKILKLAQQQMGEESSSEVQSSLKYQKKTGERFLGPSELDVSDNESGEFDFDDQDLNPEIDEADEQALKTFMIGHNETSTSGKPRKTLCDMIMEKIEEKRYELDTELSTDLDNEGAPKRKLDPRLVAMYENVGKVLSTYRSGKLPKAFKIVPKLSNWEQILFLTHPQNWTAASVYQATRIFVSNLNPKMCQRYLGLILLPRIRDDIAEYKRLNFHLYRALSRALFKPAAFFKAVLLPLCESGTCTLREATIIGSLLTKCSVPSLHAAAAMLKIAEMDYSGANSLFLRLLIDKKYTLPYRVIDGLFGHFMRFANDERQLPVLWHQSLLVFCQRYKADLSSEQRDHLMDLMRKHYHAQISPEVRRELTGTESRDVEDQQPVDSDDEMSE